MPFLRRYVDILLAKPLLSLFLSLCLAAVLIIFVPQFRMDASADSLVVEGDPDLALSREVSRRYGSSEVLLIMYTPFDELFTEENLERLGNMRDEVASLERVDGIQSILSLPLFGMGEITSLTDIDADSLQTLGDGGVDLLEAKEVLRNNQAYRNALISEDGDSASLVVSFVRNEAMDTLLQRRTALREARSAGDLSAAEADELTRVSGEYEQAKILAAQHLHQDITTIRAIIDEYRDHGEVIMGGVPMIADDLVTFVGSDLVKFGTSLVLFIILALSYLFRKPRFVILPLVCCTIIALSVIGLLGLLQWPVTVVSSNFISLLLIISISLNIHLIVRYRELQHAEPERKHIDLLSQSVQDMFKPCLYTALTTMVAFGSLIISDIPPIVDFGWMMVVGIFVAFVLTFTLFPSIMALLTKPLEGHKPAVARMTPALATFTHRYGRGILVASLALFVASLVGLTRLEVENSFINYFDEGTDIYQGMVAIDQRMGGTIPVDVLITMTPTRSDGGNAADDDWDWGDSGEESGESFDAAGWDDEWGGDWDEWDEGTQSEGSQNAYWFTSDKMARILSIHDYLDSFQETGKVLSLATLLRIAYELNDGPLDSLELAVLYNRIPDEYKAALLDPYVSVEEDQVRFSLRVMETDPNLRRDQLIRDIRSGLEENFNLEPSQVQLSGMLVLYNNMLQSLYESQVLTLGLVLLIIMLMFVALFRSWKLALIGIVPNALVAVLVLGLMGWAGIALDMMTITIASVSVGIGVDHTIHYIHRYQSSFAGQGRDYLATLHYSHGSIGQAMFYTGFTIIAGFSILVLSNFVPTIIFGLLTSLAMFLALAGALTLLPYLLLLFKPLGPEHKQPA